MRRPRRAVQWGVARWCGFAALTAVFFSMWMWTRARAEVRGHMLELGAELAAMEHPGAGARELTINGAILHVASARTRLELPVALDRLERRCAGGALEVSALEEALRVEGGRAPGILDPILRWDDGSQGFVGCLRGADSLAASGAAGGIRYVYARRAAGATRLVAVWSEGPLPLERMFPAAGDAPGADLPGVPRPAGMRRVLAAHERGQPYSMIVYRGELTDLDAMREWYRAELAARGWRVSRSRASGTVHAAMRGTTLVLSLGRDAEEAWVTALVSGRASRAEEAR